VNSERPAKTKTKAEAEAEVSRTDTVRPRASFRFRIRTGMLAVLVAGVWFWLLLIPGVAALAVMPLIIGLFALGVMAAAMALGGFGILVCGAVEWLLAKSNRPPEWFHPDPPEAEQFWPTASRPIDASHMPNERTREVGRQ